MGALLIGYARCSTDQQDLTAQREGLTALGVATTRIYVDYADGRVMPTSGRKPLARRVNELDRSA
jgi:DNA invertase Pin-like site-specific DNA recombinase